MDHRTNRRQFGEAQEQRVARYLESKGLTLIACNYFCKMGEIDLIMRDAETLVFVEVRYRRSTRYGSAVETVTWKKQQKLLRCARHFLLTQGLDNRLPVRFDVVGVSSGSEVEWIQSAFA